MVRPEEIIKTKLLRGEIINKLYDMYGSATPIRAINKLLRYNSYYSDTDVRKAVEYLRGVRKEFIEVILDENDYWASFVLFPGRS